MKFAPTMKCYLQGRVNYNPPGYRPFLGYEGTNQIADLVYNLFNLGMEDHLLDVFGGHAMKEVISTNRYLNWTPKAEMQFFVLSYLQFKASQSHANMYTQ